MKTLASDKAEILTRLSHLHPDSPRQWGKMTPHQMLCHLTDSFVAMMGGNAISDKSSFFLRGALTETEWMIWGYKHCDHHLQQFGL